MLQKNIRFYNDKYATKWSNIQQEASETLVAEKFKKLMPNASVYVGNYYPEADSLKKMDENEIIVISTIEALKNRNGWLIDAVDL